MASALFPFALYLRTLAPTVYGVDSAELTTGAFLLGIVHPPGAPTYLLLGHAFTWLPLGDVGYRLNLMSACAVALALLFLHAILRRLRCSTIVALAATLFVGATYYVWAAAVAAEVYAVQGCFTTLLILLALRARQDGRGVDVLAAGLAFGLALGVHPSLALLGPGLALLVLTAPRPTRPRLRSCLGALLLAAAGFCVYAYLPLRHLAHLPLDPARDSWQVDLATWQGFWWMVTSRGFSRFFFAVPVSALGAEAARYAYLLWSNFMGLGALLGLAGLIAGLRRDASLHIALLAMLLVYLAFFLPYGAGDKAVMFLPSHLLWGIWIGVAAQTLAERFHAPSGDSLAAATLAGLALFTAAFNFRFLDVSNDWSARERGTTLLDCLAPGAVYFGSFPDLRIVEYLQFVEGRRGDVKTIDLLFDDAQQARLRIVAALGGARPVYVRSCNDWQGPRWSCSEVPDCGCALLADRKPTTATPG